MSKGKELPTLLVMIMQLGNFKVVGIIRDD